MGEEKHPADRKQGAVPARQLDQVARISFGKCERFLDEGRNAGAQGRTSGPRMIACGIGDDHRVGAMSRVKFRPSSHDANTIESMTDAPLPHAGRIACRMDVDFNPWGRNLQQHASEDAGPSTSSDKGEPLQAVVYAFRHGSCRTCTALRDFRPDTTYWAPNGRRANSR